MLPIGRGRATQVLRQALRRFEIRVHFQPKVDLRTGAVVGAAALLRWQHPSHGTLGPAALLTGVTCVTTLLALTERVAHLALAHARAWHLKGRDWTIALNVPPRVLLDDRFSPMIWHVLREVDASPQWLVVEITEDGDPTWPDGAVRQLRRLQTAGVALSVDDFGVGASTLERVKRLPVDELKIDRSFVSGMDTDVRDAVLVEAAVRIGQGLGRRVVAEGVEREQVVEALRALGCDQAQGHLFAPARPGEDADRWPGLFDRRLGRAGPLGCGSTIEVGLPPPGGALQGAEASPASRA